MDHEASSSEPRSSSTAAGPESAPTPERGGKVDAEVQRVLSSRTPTAAGGSVGHSANRRSREAGNPREQAAFQRVRPFIEMLENSIDRARQERLAREDHAGEDRQGEGFRPHGRPSGRIAADGLGGAAVNSARGVAPINGMHQTGNGSGPIGASMHAGGGPRGLPEDPRGPGVRPERGLTPDELRAQSPYDAPKAAASDSEPGLAAGERLRPLIPGSSLADGRAAAEATTGGQSRRSDAETPDTADARVGASGELRPEPWRGKARKASPKRLPPRD